MLSILQREPDTLKLVIEAMVEKSAHLMTDSGSTLCDGPIGRKRAWGLLFRAAVLEAF